MPQFSDVPDATAEALPNMTGLLAGVARFGVWRDKLAAAIDRLRRWLEAESLFDPDIERRLRHAQERLVGDRFVVAFVAEFSRGKSELINAMFFADYGQRVLPSAAGRTTMCPTEIFYDPAMPPCIRTLPIETRAGGGGASDFKESANAWQVFPLDIESVEGMHEAFRLVAQTMRVPAEEARGYGLYDPEDPEHVEMLGSDGTVEISRWRHAVINFPHPLLRNGLVIIDTPGLNAIGTEPELTLSLVPSAHAMLFVLAADAGVTRSDLAIWKRVVGDEPDHGNHLIVLNKIDGLWDPLKTVAETEAEVARQVESVAATLRVDPTQVFPVSAQKGLFAKVASDDDLLRRSRLPELEAALSALLAPARREQLQSHTVATIERIIGDVRRTLTARERGLVEQLYELRTLQGKNQSAIERLLLRTQAEQREFEEAIRKSLAARSVLWRLAQEALAQIGGDAVNRLAQETRQQMRDARLSHRLQGIARGYFEELRKRLRRSGSGLAEIERMVLGVHRSLAEQLGWNLPPPMQFSLDAYIAEIDRLESAYAGHFKPIALLTREQRTFIDWFFDTVVRKSIGIITSADRDSDAWIRSLLPPLETQIREQREQLKHRTLALQRVRDAQGSLDEQIGCLEEALQNVHRQLDGLRQHAERVRPARPPDLSGRLSLLPEFAPRSFAADKRESKAPVRLVS